MAYTTINKPSDYFNTKLFTGNGGTQSVTGVGFQPDWVWLKSRSVADSPILFDVVRGVTKRLMTNSTGAESTEAQEVQSFDSDGFTVGSSDNANRSGATMVGWNWLGANGTASNTDGSITSTVSANTTSGFSIVSYTGNGTAGATIGHGLGSTPAMIIARIKSQAKDWNCYHQSLGATKQLVLNTNAAVVTTSDKWNDTTPTSSVFTVGDSSQVNMSGESGIAYCFAEKTGFSKFGSYTGNGNADGTFVYTGFKPAWVLVKCTSAQADWELSDNKRTTSGGNVIDKEVRPNSSAAETGGTDGRYIDYVSNGFKLRQGFGNWNDSGATYIFMAFAEAPLVGSNGVTAKAR